MLRSVARGALGLQARCLASACSQPAMPLASLTSLLSSVSAASAGPASTCSLVPDWQKFQGTQGLPASVRAFSAGQLLAGAQRDDGRTPAPSGGGSSSGSSSGDGRGSGSSKEVVYKGRGMRLFRILVRMKVFQLAGVAALAIPITTFLSQGEVSSLQAVIASALLLGSGVASTALWYYSRRYVGELAVLRDAAGRPTAARFSVLDFWGNREDNDVPLPAMVPPLQGVVPAVRAVMLSEMLIPVDVEGDRQYFLSLRYGHILDKQQLLALLEGRLEQRAEQAQHGVQAGPAGAGSSAGGAAGDGGQ